MKARKSVNKIVSFLLALIFVSTNTAYSLDRTLRVPLQTKRVEEFLSRVTERDQALKRATETVRISVIGGNWKMEVTSKEEAEALLRNIIESIKGKDISNVEVVVGVPIAFMDHLSGILRSAEANEENLKGKIKIAAQNIAGAEKGAQTGRTSILQVKTLGATYVIIGHSEQRRDEKEELVPAENRAINNKVKLTLGQNLIPIICVGESKSERGAGKTNEIVLDMLTQALDGLTPEQVANSIIAYEPVWAIGKGKTAATPQQAEEVLRFIRRLIFDMFGEDTASKVRIIYGGSVKPDNIAGLMDKSVIPDNDGALVGGASLKAALFIGILEGVPVRLARGTATTTISIGRDCTVGIKLIERPFLLGDEPDVNSAIIQKTGLVTEITVAIAAGLKAEGWVGKAIQTRVDSLGEPEKQAKKTGAQADGRATKIMNDTVVASGNRVHVMGEEGEKDGLGSEELFGVGGVINPDGTTGDESVIADVIDGTTLTVTNNNRLDFDAIDIMSPGGISMLASGKIIERRGLGSDNYYKIGLFFNVPPEKRQAFIDSPIDPDIDDGNFEAAKEQARQALTRIADANNTTLDNIEIVLMRRGRDNYKKSILDALGIKWYDFQDGTPGHAVLANLKPNTGKVRVFWTVMKSTEGGWNEAVADALYQAGYGAIGYTKIYSDEINYANNDMDAQSSEREKSNNMARRFVWTDAVRQEITQKYPKDYEAILAGKKLFVTGEISGTLDASMTFITDNKLFNQRGIGELQADGTIEVPTLRIRAIQEDGKWKCYAFIEKRKVNYRNYCLAGLINAPEERVASWMEKFGINRNSISPEEKEWLTALLRLKESGQQAVINYAVDEVINGVLQKRLVLELNKDKTEIISIGHVLRKLLENIKGVLEFDADGNVFVVDVDKLRSETIDYLVREAALSSNDDVKTAAQFLIRSAAISLGIIPASIHDFYMARKTNAWKNMTVPAVNIRTDGYETTRQVFRVVREQNIGAIILELAKSETRYSGQSVAEFTTVGFAAAIKEDYTGQIFFQGDHYQVDQKKYAKEPNKEIDTLKRFIRESILAGEYNIDLDPSTLVNEEALDEIVVFENSLVDEYLKGHSELTQGLDESGLKALRHKLIDELTLTEEQKAQLDALYERMHSDTAAVTMELIRYIRGLEKELFEGKVTISIGIEERHIDNPKHKNNPSTVRGSIALAQKVLKMCAAEGLVGPSKIALQTGTMHGLGGTVDFGIYERHLLAAQSIGIHVFVQHGASTIKKRADFGKMPIGGVGEVHLATEYQKITLGIVARMMPDLAEKMAQYLEDLMAANPDAYGKKFGEKWAQAFNDPAQQGKSRHDIIVEILADELPGKLAGSLKDLTKELSGPFKNEIWNAPAPVREAMRQALYKEFSEIFQMLGARETRELVESIIPVAKQPVVLAQRPEILTQAIAVASRKVGKGSPLHGAIAINNAGYKVGQIITRKGFAGLRNWSASTIGYELQSLVAIGILSRQDAGGKNLPRGEYRITVLPSEGQLNEINEKAKAIVNKTGRNGEALGIDYWILDVLHLSQRQLEEIAKVVGEVTGSVVTPELGPVDFLQEDISAGMDLPASAAINGDVPFTVAGISLADAAGAAKTEQQALLAGLVDAKIASPEGKLKVNAYDFSVVPAKVVMYKEEFVTDTPGQFETAFKTLQPDQTAVIIVINKTDDEITQALIQANLSQEWGNRIVVMGVRPDSPSAQAFGRLFGDKNMFDLRGQTTDQILGNKDLVEGLKGAV